MKFPISSAIVPEAVLNAKAVTLSIPACGGDIPPAFPWSVLDASGNRLTGGATQMTKDQWDKWDDSGSDEDYILECVAANVGLTLK